MWLVSFPAFSEYAYFFLRLLRQDLITKSSPSDNESFMEHVKGHHLKNNWIQEQLGINPHFKCNFKKGSA
jgi:hypothetical protein